MRTALLLTIMAGFLIRATAHADTVISAKQIGGQSIPLSLGDAFGRAVAEVGDLDNNGVNDLAVGAPGTDSGTGNDNQGSVWILFLDPDSTDHVGAYLQIGNGMGGFPSGALAECALFGYSATTVGDLDGNGVKDLAVGAPENRPSCLVPPDSSALGEVWLLFLNDNGTVDSTAVIADGMNGFPVGVLDLYDRFGTSLAWLGDLGTAEDDTVGVLAVGAQYDDDGGSNPDSNVGAVWLLALSKSGKVLSTKKISATSGGFPGHLLEDGDWFGVSVTSLGDVNGDDIPDISIGAYGDDDGGVEGNPHADRGATWNVLLSPAATVTAVQKISATEGGLVGPLHDRDAFGYGLGSLDRGELCLLVGGPGDDDGGEDRGACWLLTLGSNGNVVSEQKISQTQGCFPDTFPNASAFGASLAQIEDDVIAVGAPSDHSGTGSVWLLELGDPASIAVEWTDGLSIVTAGPNPASDQVSPTYRTEFTGIVKTQVVDLQGRVVAILANEVQQAGLHSVLWRVSDFSAGIYFIEVATPDRTYHRKVTITR